MKFTGADELRAKLATLKASTAKRIMRRQITKASRVVGAAAKTNVPVEFGLLKKAIGQKVKTAKEAVVGIIGPRRGFKELRIGARSAKWVDPVRYAHLAEKGTQPHTIVIPVQDKDYDVEIVQHPGARARPWLGPAYDSSLGTVKRLLGDDVGREIEREAAK